MPLQTVSVSIDIPDGYEACGSEAVVTRPLITCGGDGDCVVTRVLVRPVWKWPEWIKPGAWIAMDEDGSWSLFADEPICEGELPQVWNSRYSGFGIGLCRELAKHFSHNFDPPPCTDWRQSKRQKPL